MVYRYVIFCSRFAFTTMQVNKKSGSDADAIFIVIQSPTQSSLQEDVKDD